MENKKEYLNEENYEKGKEFISKIAKLILVLGLIIGGTLIVIGIVKQVKINDKYSESNRAEQIQKLEEEKEKINEDIETEKQNVLASQTQLKDKIKPVEDEIKSLERETFTGFNDEYYARQDRIEELKESIKKDKKSISTIDKALDDSFDHCAFSEAQNNEYTSKYCSLKNQLGQKNYEINNLKNENYDFDRDFDSSDSIPFFIFGGFTIFGTLMFSGMFFLMTKRREIMAFQAQQVMPVAQEGLEKMAPTLGNVAETIGEKVAPTYGKMAKEISKGIKEGLKDEETNTDKKTKK